MKSIKKSQTGILLFAILIVAFWYRIQGFLYNTFAFTYDVGRDFLAVSKMLSEHKPLLIGATTGLHGVFYGPTWYYILTPFFLLTGGDPRWIAFFMALSGVLTVILGYILGKSISGKPLGLTFALLIGVSEVLNQISAQIWNPNLIPLFVLLSFILILKENEKKLISVFFLGLTLGIIFDLELVFGLIFFLSTLLYIVSLRLFKRMVSWGLLFGGFILIQLPRILFELRHDFLMTKTLFGAFNASASDSLLSPIPNFTKIIPRLFEVFYQTVGWQNWLAGLFALFFIIFISFYCFKRIEKKEKKFLVYSAFILITFLMGLGFFKHDIESHYYIGIPVIFVCLTGFSIYLLKKYLRLNYLLFIAILATIAVFLNQLKLVQTFIPSNWIGDASVYRNQLEVVNYIYQDTKGEEFNSITYTPPVYDYPYQYLFSWWGKKTYGYVPAKDHKKNFYLILEPDLQFPIRLKNWLALRKGDGVVVSEKRFKSGIVVEKRYH